ncbi:MAG: hypothetical protein L0H64_19600 [Pseudonocardia sp.]|nr:hypothetical protein [Pseudonocardia sp.]
MGSAVIGGIGVATLAQVRHPREVPFAALPALFAVHQFTEGLVWLGLQGRIPDAVGDAAAYAYLLYAQGIVPVLVPLAVLLIEPTRWRRLAVAPFLAIGLAAGGYLFWVDIAHPVGYRIVHHSIAYENSGALVGVFAVAYVIATCGAALFSGYPWIVVFGVANLVALAVTLIVLAAAFTSVWCFAAALLSVLVLLFFLRTRRREPGAAPSESVGC